MAILTVSPTNIEVTSSSQNSVDVNFTCDKTLTDVKISMNDGITYKDKINMTQTKATFDITGMMNGNYSCKLKGYYEEVIPPPSDKSLYRSVAFIPKHYDMDKALMGIDAYADKYKFGNALICLPVYNNMDTNVPEIKLSDAQINQIIDKCEQRGLNWTLKCHNMSAVEDGTGNYEQPTNPQLWFSNLKVMCNRIADIVVSRGGDKLILTNEMGNVTTIANWKPYFVEVINSVKAKGLKVASSVNIKEIRGEDGFQYWNELDFFTVNAYPQLTNKGKEWAKQNLDKVREDFYIQSTKDYDADFGTLLPTLGGVNNLHKDIWITELGCIPNSNGLWAPAYWGDGLLDDEEVQKIFMDTVIDIMEVDNRTGKLSDRLKMYTLWDGNSESSFNLIGKQGEVVLDKYWSTDYVEPNYSAPVSSVSLDKTSYTFTEFGSIKLNATVLPANATNKNVTWYSTDENVATVTNDGNVTCVKAGNCVVYAVTTQGSKVASCNITVNSNIKENLFDIATNNKYPVNLVSNSIDLTNKTITVTSSNNNGFDGYMVFEVYGLDATKRYKLTANSDNNYSDITVTNNTGVSLISDKGKTSYDMEFNGDSTRIDVKFGITRTSEVGNLTAIYSNVKIVEVETTTPPPTVSVTDVRLNKTMHNMSVDDTFQLIATVLPSDATNKSVTWSSSNSSVCSVNTNGLVTAKAGGNATITVTTVDGKKTAPCSFYVEEGTTPPPTVSVAGVNLNKTTHSMKTNETVQLSATILPYNATNKSVTWSSSNASIATVANGLVTAKAKGDVVITVTTQDGNKTATCNISITETTAPPAGGDNYFDINNTLIEEKGCTHSVDKTNKTVTVTSDYSSNYYGYLIWDTSKIREGRRYRLTCKSSNDKTFVRFRVEGEKIIEDSMKNAYSIEFTGVDTRQKITDICLGIRQIENIGTLTSVFSEIEIIDLDGDPPPLPQEEVTYDVIDYKIIVKKGGITESYHSNDDIPQNLQGEGGVDGHKLIIKNRIKHYLSLTRGNSPSQITIDGMKPFNYSLIDLVYKGQWITNGYAVYHNTLKYTIANRIDGNEWGITDDRPINQYSLDRAISIYNCAIPGHMEITYDPDSVNSISEAMFNDEFLGICRLGHYQGKKFHIHQNVRLLGGFGNTSRLYVAVVVHELGHTTGINDHSPHRPTTYLYNKKQENEWLQPSDIAHIKDKFPHLTGDIKSTSEVSISNNDVDVLFNFRHYENEEEMKTSAYATIEGKYIGKGKSYTEYGLDYNVYKFEVGSNIVKVNVHKSFELGLVDGTYYKMYLNEFNYLLNPRETIIKLGGI